MTSIGLIGAGVMGSRMALRLHAAGRDVKVWARNQTRIEELQRHGIRTAEFEEVCSRDVLVTCLRDDAAVAEVLLNGGIDSIAARLVIDHATYSPALSTRVRQHLGERGVSLVDAPISGGPSAAEHGTLVSMVGAAPDDLAQVEPIISSYCSQVVHTGLPGTGLALKLVNQHLVAAHSVAAAEAASLIRHYGITPSVALNALMHGWAASTRLKLQLQDTVQGNFAPDGASVGKFLPLLSLVESAFTEAGVESDLLPAVKHRYSATADLDPEAPFAALTSTFRGNTNDRETK